MSLTAIIVFGVIIVPMIIMAVFLLNGKGAFLIAGYNTMSESEKSVYDEKALCRFTGKLLIAVSFAMLLFPVGIYFEITWLLYVGIVLIMAGTVCAVIYTNTGNRFKKIAETSDDKKYSKATVIVVAAISVIVLFALSVLFYQGEKDPVVDISGGGIQIKSMYGLSVDFSDITEITLIDKSMSDIGIGKRTNGYGGFGEALKGYFISDAVGETLLFVQSKSSPTILIERQNGRDIYISFRNSEKTNKLYNDIKNIKDK